MDTHLDTSEFLRKFLGIFIICDVFMTSSMSNFYVILQFLATTSVKKNVETLVFHLEYVLGEDLSICKFDEQLALCCRIITS